MGTMAIRSSGLGAIHAMCYPPAIKYHLSHGLSIALIMPYIMEYNFISNLAKFANIARALGMKTEGLSLHEAALKSIEAVRLLLQDLGLSRRLRDFGIPRRILANMQRMWQELPPSFYRQSARSIG